MEIISKFFEKIVLFFAATGSILIVGGIAWLFWIIISDKAISLFLALLASIPPVVLYIGILSEFSCKKERRWKRSINGGREASKISTRKNFANLLMRV